MRAVEFIQKEDSSQWLVTNPIYGKANRMSPEELAMWKGRAKALLTRMQRIYAQLLAIVPEEDRAALSGVKLDVPTDGVDSWGVSNFDDKKIELDVGSFWDLSNDSIAYVLGHEIGHMVWAFGREKNWPRTRGKKWAPAALRQQEMDADVYGCRLALQLGYDRRKAWDHFTIAVQREAFDPAYPTYPSVSQRKANIEKDIKAQAAIKAQQAQTPAPAPATEPEPQAQPANPETADKNAWLGHIMGALSHFEQALAADPNLALA